LRQELTREGHRAIALITGRYRERWVDSFNKCFVGVCRGILERGTIKDDTRFYHFNWVSTGKENSLLRR
jgi:hypothetical protein